MAALAWCPATPAPTHIFSTSDAAKNALFYYAIENGFALVVKRSGKAFVTLSCSQGGEKRSHAAQGWTPIN